MNAFIKRHRLWIGVLIVIVVGLGGVLLVSLRNAPVASSVQVVECLQAAEGCLQFPTITGTNLLGEEQTLPADLARAYNLVIVSFEEEQTTRAQGWLPLAQELAGIRSNFTFYSLPILGGDINPLVRGLILGGMVALIPDEALRRATIMFFLEDKQRFLDVLQIPDVDGLQLFLLDAQGQVLWRAAGDYAEAPGDELRALLTALP